MFEENYNSLNPQSLIKDIVAANFRTAAIFEKHGIDFCCRGNRSLSDAVQDKNLDLSTVIEDLSLSGAGREGAKERYDLWDLDYLAQYIINNHHKYVSSAIPVIHGHLEKIAGKHGPKHPYLVELKSLFEEIANELLSHMMKEEKILFPAIIRMAEIKRGNMPAVNIPFSIEGPVSVMELEHTSAGDILQRMRDITNNYTLPQDACNTFAVTFMELDDFEKDLHKHIFLENSILFPKALEMEKELV